MANHGRFRCRRPATAKAGKPHRDLAEKRRDHMVPVILYSAKLATVSAVRPPNGVALGLRSDDLLLEASQQQLPSARVNPKSAISPRSSGRLIFKTSTHCFSPLASIFTNLTIQATRLPPSEIRRETIASAPPPPISRQSLFWVTSAGHERFIIKLSLCGTWHWRARRDSNSRPVDPKSTALIR
jgi:hypothetical protein